VTTEVNPYRDGLALWDALTTRAKTVAQATGADTSALIRQFVYERFLARVFHDPSAPWVLKGGTAVLARVNDARTTKDIDLLRELDDLDAALARLREAAAFDLGDHFRFIVTKHEGGLGGTAQPDVNGYKVYVETYCGGTKPRQRFTVDVVTGSLMTAAPEVSNRPSVVEIPGLSAPSLRLYPVVDHIADKLCATQATYGTAGDLPSSRVRDLVDLVVFARRQDVDGTALIAAIRGEWIKRGLDGDPVFAPPATWDRLYPKVARSVPACGELTSFADASAFVAGFLSPALDGSAAGQRWAATAGTWEPQGT
jgi:Nucleotidyl transferase AbiEii toxin, Type IV TA system